MPYDSQIPLVNIRDELSEGVSGVTRVILHRIADEERYLR